MREARHTIVFPDNNQKMHVCILAACSICLAALTMAKTPALAASADKSGQSAAKDSQDKNTKARQARSAKPSALTMSSFLDRLMTAESGGRDHAANPRSTARGAFQFINSTFLKVARRHFPDKIAKLSDAQILALRYQRDFARKSAEAYTRDNAAYLARRGHKPSFVNLRLAFLLGPQGASRVLEAKPQNLLSAVLSPAALKANPFMRRMTVAGLIAKAANDLRVSPGHLAGLKIKPGSMLARRKPRIKLRCNLSRPSCRRWLALKRRKLRMAEQRRRQAAK